MEIKGRLILWIDAIQNCLDTIEFFERCSEAQNYSSIINENKDFFERPENERKGAWRPFPTLTEIHFLKYKLIDLLSVEFWRLYATGNSLSGFVAKNQKNGHIDAIRKEMEEYAESKGIDLERLEFLKSEIQFIRDKYIAHQDGDASDMRIVDEGQITFATAPTFEPDDVMFLKEFLLVCKEFCFKKV